MFELYITMNTLYLSAIQILRWEVISRMVHIRGRIFLSFLINKIDGGAKIQIISQLKPNLLDDHISYKCLNLLESQTKDKHT